MSDYDYLNARVCAMRAGLLSSETLEELLTLGDVRTIAERLLDTAYRTGLATSMAQHEPLDALDRALDSCLQDAVQRIIQMSDGAGRAWVRVLVSDWDVQAIKTVLRGVRRQLPAAEVAAAVGTTADLTRESILALAEQADIRGVIDLLVTWSSPWAACLKRARPAYEEAQDVGALEHELDVARFEAAYALGASRADRDGVALELIAIEAELLNVVRCLIHMGSDRPLRLVPQPQGVSRTVRALRGAKDLSDATRILADSPYRRTLDAALPFLSHTGHVAMFARMLQREKLYQSHHLALQDPLSVAVVCDYLRCKQNEVINLKLIARGRASGMPTSAIRAGIIRLAEAA